MKEGAMTQDSTRYMKRAFSLATALTGGTHDAESIVMTAIEAVPRDMFSETSLLAEVAKVAWTRSQLETEEWQEVSDEQPPVPNELQRVAALPIRNRYCFTMRILAGITAHTCARLLGMHPDQVEYLVQLSVQMISKAAQSQDHQMSLVAR